MRAAIRIGLKAIGWASAVAALTSGSGAWGQGLSDPTRPPADWIAAQAKRTEGSQEGVTGAPAATLPTSATGVAQGEGAPQLQSLLIGPSPRKFAIINGQIVAVGAAYGDAKLIDVGPGEAVLLTERGKTILKLFPNVEKTQPKPAAGARDKTSAKVKHRVVRRSISPEREAK